MSEKQCLQIIVTLLIAFAFIAIVFGVVALSKVNDAVEIGKRLEAKVNETYEVLKPLGQSAVNKSIEAIGSVDANRLGQRITEKSDTIIDKAGTWVENKVKKQLEEQTKDWIAAKMAENNEGASD